MRTEFDWIDDLRRRAGSPDAASGLRVGIGDDCAVAVPPPGEELLLTTDLLVEDVHFRLAGLDPFDLGWKSLAVSVSDVASCGGRAAHALVSAALRPEQSGAFADRLLEGLLACAARHGVTLAGGDTTGTPGPVIVNVALVGFAPARRAVLRSGARVGDAICVTGALGGSILGRHLRVEARQDSARSLVQGGVVHAMIDLSDGLSSDLGHILDASGVGAELFADRVPVHGDALRLAATSGRSPLDHALSDGEDFELCFTLPEERAAAVVASGLAGVPVSRIGRVLPPSAGYRMLPAECADPGTAVPVERRGHDHFRR